MTYWKVNRYIKDRRDYDLVVKLYEKYFIKLKELFIHTAATTTQYPHVNQESAFTLLKTMQITDDKVVTP